MRAWVGVGVGGTLQARKGEQLGEPHCDENPRKDLPEAPASVAMSLVTDVYGLSFQVLKNLFHLP